MILEEETFEKYGYYSTALSPKSSKKILAACDDCGKIRAITKQGYRALCTSCVRKGQTRSEVSKKKQSESVKGYRNHFFNKKHTSDTRILISKNRNYKRGKEHPAWVPRVIHKCLTCGETFEVENHRLKYGQGKYCSYSCATKGRMHNISPHMTVPEKVFEAMCIKYNLPFRFVGDGSLWLGNANPDFVHNTKKIVIEVFGDYWHSPLLRPTLRYNETVKGRRKQFKFKGYKLIVFWETDLKREDAEAFVLHELNEHKVL